MTAHKNSPSRPNPLACYTFHKPDQSPQLVDRIGDRILTFNDTHPRHEQFKALFLAAPELEQQNAALVAALQLHLDFLEDLRKRNPGWLGKCVADIGLLNDAYIASSKVMSQAKGDAL